MADIRIRDLPTASPPVSTDFVPIDNGTTRKTDIQTLVETGRPAASQAEAEAGVNSTKVMTPLTTKQSIASEVGVTLASAAQGALAATALQPAAIGVSVQAFDADLTAIAALTSAADKVPYSTGSETWAMTGLTAAGRALIDDADAAAQRATLGLSTSPTFSTDITIDGAAATNRALRFTTANVLRWQMIGNNNAESGANAGTNLSIARYNDAGTFLSIPFWIERATGEVGVNQTNPSANLDVGGTFNVSGNATIGGNHTVTGNIVNTALPNLSKSVQGTGVPGLDQAHWMIWNSQTDPTFDPTPTLRIDRNASPSVVAGTPANTYQAVKINGTAGVNNQGYEWPLTVEMHNYALSTLNSENVAINGTAWLEINGAGETGKTWAANFNVSDKTTTVNPAKGRVALELDNYAHPSGSTDNNRARVGLQIAVGTYDSSTPGSALHFGRAFLVGANQTNIVIDRLMEISGSGSYDIGIDTTAATFTKPVLFMKEAQAISFDGNSSGVFSRSLFYQTGSLAYKVSSNVVFTISDVGAVSASGNINTDGQYTVDGTRVVTNRVTGWGAPTGTATRTTFATGTVTTAQLAERVKALIDDLTTHGLIGA